MSSITLQTKPAIKTYSTICTNAKQIALDNITTERHKFWQCYRDTFVILCNYVTMQKNEIIFD
jgi:hypothetical protein